MDDQSAIKLELVADQLRGGGTLNVKAGGNSMKPFIRAGDILTLKGVSGAKPRRGEIVAFIRNGLLYIHRIVDAGGQDETLLTKGDALAISDFPVRRDEILAVVTGINNASPNPRKSLFGLFFRLYRFSLLAWNGATTLEGKRIVRISAGPARFRISRMILAACRFFVYL